MSQQTGWASEFRSAWRDSPRSIAPRFLLWPGGNDLENDLEVMEIKSGCRHKKQPQAGGVEFVAAIGFRTSGSCRGMGCHPAWPDRRYPTTKSGGSSQAPDLTLHTGRKAMRKFALATVSMPGARADMVGAAAGAGTGLLVASPVGAVAEGVIGAVFGGPFWGPPISRAACLADNDFCCHCRLYWYH